MRLEITGNISALQLQEVVAEAYDKWVEKMIADNPEMDDLMTHADAKITGVTVDFQFKPESTTDWQVLTTDNHEGIPEVLVVTAQTDESGNLLWDTVKDNDGDSNFSEVEALITAGTNSIADKPEIQSVYADKQLLNSAVYSMFNGTTVNVIQTVDETVVQAYVLQATEIHSEPKLISEVAFPQEAFSELSAHYSELAEL